MCTTAEIRKWAISSNISLSYDECILPDLHFIFLIFISYLFIHDDPIQVNKEPMGIQYVYQATHITIWDRKKKTSLPK